MVHLSVFFAREQACLQQARDYMCEFATALGVPLFFQLPEALEYVKSCVMEVSVRF